MEKKCESCGMPMTNKSDYGGADTGNKYCVYCCDPLGKLKAFEEKLDDISSFIMRTSDVSAEKARNIAREKLVKQPAWQKYK